MRNNRFWFVLFVLSLVCAGDTWAQGLPTATLTGRVINEGQGLPGVNVAVKSANLQGTRTTVTSINGDYTFVALPPGKYSVTFALSGFQPVGKQADLGAAQSVAVNATLSLTAVSAEATVVARAENISETTQAATTYTSDILNKLPVTRSLVSAVVLAPGVNSNGPGAAITISGAQSFDNLFLINGANVVDNVRGTPFNLFIEDAIQETTTTTSGVSAEYGRFAGGVVNTVTKSGGNNFSGSLRTSFADPAWSAVQPTGTKGLQDLQETYEATLGGPIVKDTAWFFGAGRYNKTSTTYTTPFTNIGVDQPTDEKRYEGKLTLTPLQSQTLTLSYLGIQRSENNHYFTSVPVYDLASFTDRKTPENFTVANYSGVVTRSFFVEGQFSQRHFTFEGDGSRYTDLVRGTPIIEQANYIVFNSPIFCAACPNADTRRDNQDYFLKGTYFLSTPTTGTHNLVIGVDEFRGHQLSNNYQSGSQYIFYSTAAQVSGTNVTPVIASPESSFLSFWPISVLGRPSDLKTDSAFLNDAWKLNNNLSFNMGIRWDKNHAVDSVGVVRQNNSAWSPRLGVTFDPKGNGILRFNASYARYASAVQENFAGAASAGGNPSYLFYFYNGPEINTGNAPFLSTADALAQVFQWFGITQPGMFPTRNNTDFVFPPVIQGLTQGIAPGITSPHNDEFVLGMSGSLNPRVTYRVDGIYRKAGGFISTVINQGTGQVTDQFGGVFDFGVVQNTSTAERRYLGLNTQIGWRPFDGLTVGGNWTWSHTYGNLDGETSGSGPVPSSLDQYPEYRDLAWAGPSGNLSQDERHRVRLFGAYDLNIPKALGHLGVSTVFQFDTGTPYSAAANPALSAGVNVAKYVSNPGYATPPVTQVYYFSSRGAYFTENVYRTDLALNYSYDIGPVQLFVQPQVLNVFNAQHSIAVNTTVFTTQNDPTGKLVDFNPFTTAPKEGVNWEKGPNFGKPTSAAMYQFPRTFQVSVGLRF